MTPRPPASFTRFAVRVRCISPLFILVQTEQDIDTPSVWVGNHFHLWIKFWCQFLLPSLTFKNGEDLDNEFSEEKNPIPAITVITKVATLPLLAVRIMVGVTQGLPAPSKSPDLILLLETLGMQLKSKQTKSLSTGGLRSSGEQTSKPWIHEISSEAEECSAEPEWMGWVGGIQRRERPEW